jgi:2-octaprenyl-6-methoxyphenol hydroxylase
MSEPRAPRPPNYDVVIVGGGLIGGSLACTLGGTGLKVAVVESVAPGVMAKPTYDERVIALSWGSRRILDALGLWAGIAAESAPIEQVHISDRGHFGFARLDHEDIGVAALGYVVPARVLNASIQAALAAASGVERLCPARVVDQRVDSNAVSVRIQDDHDDRWIDARVLIAADGSGSPLGEALGVMVEDQPYGQDAVISTVTASASRPGMAFERFTETGPLAMLPMTGGRYSVVWTCREDETAGILALSDADFIARLQARFGYRLGRLTRPAARRAYPLRLSLVRDPVRERAVLIGNAAHTLHPVAGQGFNLGLRDVAALAEVLSEAADRGDDPGAVHVLADYEAWRGRDTQGVATITDGLARLFVNPWLPLRLARGAGMIGLDLLPGARRAVARRFMGATGRLPRLARGLPLRDRPAGMAGASGR